MKASRYHVVHTTRYAYSAPMADGYNIGFLLPRPTPHQMVERATVAIDPTPDEQAERFDAFGNRLTQFGVHHQHDVLTVEARSTIVLEPLAEVAPGPPWETVADLAGELVGGEALGVRPFLGGGPVVAGDADVEHLSALTDPAFTPGRPIVDAVRAFCHAIYEQFDYDSSFSDVSTPLGAVLAARRGVCQDFAHLAVAGLRRLGLPARYVSGYMETDPPPGQPKLRGADASHAWAAVWVPEEGWIDFDPTNDRLPTHRHVTVAWGRNYDDVPPLRGVVIGPHAVQTLSVSVDVERVGDAV